MKRIATLITLVLMVGAFALPAGPARADTFTGFVRCEGGYPLWPFDSGSGGGCGGVATGAGQGPTGPVVCDPLCSFDAYINSYSEPCPVPGTEIPPLFGLADGTLTVTATGLHPGSATARFSWVRVGLGVVLVYPETVGVAAFVPLPPYGTCQIPLGLNAVVAGPFAFGP